MKLHLPTSQDVAGAIDIRSWTALSSPKTVNIGVIVKGCTVYCGQYCAVSVCPAVNMATTERGAANWVYGRKCAEVCLPSGTSKAALKANSYIPCRAPAVPCSANSHIPCPAPAVPCGANSHIPCAAPAVPCRANSHIPCPAPAVPCCANSHIPCLEPDVTWPWEVAFKAGWSEHGRGHGMVLWISHKSVLTIFVCVLWSSSVPLFGTAANYLFLF